VLDADSGSVPGFTARRENAALPVGCMVP